MSHKWRAVEKGGYLETTYCRHVDRSDCINLIWHTHQTFSLFSFGASESGKTVATVTGESKTTMPAPVLMPWFAPKVQRRHADGGKKQQSTRESKSNHSNFAAAERGVAGGILDCAVLDHAAAMPHVPPCLRHSQTYHKQRSVRHTIM